MSNQYNPYSNANPNQMANPAATPSADDGIKVNGLAQVVEMLQFADPTFRESLLKRINQRDPQLAARLRRQFG